MREHVDLGLLGDLAVVVLCLSHVIHLAVHGWQYRHADCVVHGLKLTNCLRLAQSIHWSVLVVAIMRKLPHFLVHFFLLFEQINGRNGLLAFSTCHL